MTDPVATARSLVAHFNDSPVEELARQYAPGARVHPAGHPEPIDAPAWCDRVALIRAAHPGLALQTLHVASTADLVLVEGRLTGHEMDLAGVVVIETADGLVTAERHYWRE